MSQLMNIAAQWIQTCTGVHNTAVRCFSLCWINMAQLPTCHPQSERLLSQNQVFRLARVWNSFTSHLFSDFILNQWPFSSDGRTYGMWLPAAHSRELCTQEGNIGRNRCKVNRIRRVYCVIFGIEMNDAACVCVCVMAAGSCQGCFSAKKNACTEGYLIIYVYLCICVQKMDLK